MCVGEEGDKEERAAGGRVASVPHVLCRRRAGMLPLLCLFVSVCSLCVLAVFCMTLLTRRRVAFLPAVLFCAVCVLLQRPALLKSRPCHV